MERRGVYVEECEGVAAFILINVSYFFFFLFLRQSSEAFAVETRTFPDLSEETWEVRRVGGKKVRVARVGTRRDGAGHGLSVKTLLFVCNSSGSKSGQMRHCAKDKRWEKLTRQTCFSWESVPNEGDAASARPTGGENNVFFFKRELGGKLTLTGKINMFWGSDEGTSWSHVGQVGHMNRNLRFSPPLSTSAALRGCNNNTEVAGNRIKVSRQRAAAFSKEDRT